MIPMVHLRLVRLGSLAMRRCMQWPNTNAPCTGPALASIRTPSRHGHGEARTACRMHSHTRGRLSGAPSSSHCSACPHTKARMEQTPECASFLSLRLSRCSTHVHLGADGCEGAAERPCKGLEELGALPPCAAVRLALEGPVQVQVPVPAVAGTLLFGRTRLLDLPLTIMPLPAARSADGALTLCISSSMAFSRAPPESEPSNETALPPVDLVASLALRCWYVIPSAEPRYAMPRT